MEGQFNRLCNEMTVMILNFLPTEDKRHARQVCHKWNDLVTLRMNFVIPFNDQTLTWISKSTVAIHHLKLQDFKTPLTFSNSRSEFTKRIQTLTVESLSNPQSVQLLINSVKIEILTFSSGALWTRNYYSLQFLKYNNLKNLTVHVKEGNTKQTKAFVNLGYFSHFPNLDSLCLDWEPPAPYSARLFAVEYFAMFALISKHHETLRFLKLKVPQELIWDAAVFDKIDNPHLQKLVDKINQVKLVELSIKYASFEGTSPFNLGIHLTRCQAKLEKLVICSTIFPCVHEAIFKSSGTLKAVGIISNSSANFDCEPLQYCQNLRILEIFTPLKGETMNIRKLPKKIQNFFHKGPLTEEDLIWISQNLTSLKEIALVNPQGNHYHVSLDIFVALITGTAVTKFCVWCQCDHVEICNFCTNNPGLDLTFKPQNCSPTTNLYIITVDRALLL